MFGRRIVPLWAHGEQWMDSVRMNMVSTQRIDLREGHYQQGVQELLALLSELPEPPAERPTGEYTFEPRNPYKGLRAFNSADAGDFFGRERLVSEMLDMVGATLSALDAQTPAERFLAVVGPSGSGKSSVVMAGLLPQMQHGMLPNSEQWTYLTPMIPGAHPLDTLAFTLWGKLAEKSVKAIREDLADSAADGLQLLAPLIAQRSASKVVLVIDQFEELFTQVSDEQERRQVIDLVANAVTADRDSHLARRLLHGSDAVSAADRPG